MGKGRVKRILISDDCCVVCVREMEREREREFNERDRREEVQFC